MQKSNLRIFVLLVRFPNENRNAQPGRRLWYLRGINDFFDPQTHRTYSLMSSRFFRHSAPFLMSLFFFDPLCLLSAVAAPAFLFCDQTAAPWRSAATFAHAFWCLASKHLWTRFTHLGPTKSLSLHRFEYPANDSAHETVHLIQCMKLPQCMKLLRRTTLAAPLASAGLYAVEMTVLPPGPPRYV